MSCNVVNLYISPQAQMMDKYPNSNMAAVIGRNIILKYFAL